MQCARPDETQSQSRQTGRIGTELHRHSVPVVASASFDSATAIESRHPASQACEVTNSLLSRCKLTAACRRLCITAHGRQEGLATHVTLTSHALSRPRARAQAMVATSHRPVTV